MGHEQGDGVVVEWKRLRVCDDVFHPFYAETIARKRGAAGRTHSDVVGLLVRVCVDGPRSREALPLFDHLSA
jgi:hypothetical protein